MTKTEPQKPVDTLRRQALRLLQHVGDGGAAEAGPRDFAAMAAAPAPTRAVMVGVVTMPAVFIAVVLGALALFGKPAADSKTGGEATVATLEQPALVPAVGATLAASRKPVISLGEDMAIADISLDGDRVALHVESPMGQEILIYDYTKGRIVAEAPIETASIETADTLAMLTGAPPPRAARPVVEAPAPAVSVPAGPETAATPPSAPSMKPRTSD